MHRLKILGVALMAVFALSVLVSATASAAVVVLPEVEESWKGESGIGSLEVLKGAANIDMQKRQIGRYIRSYKTVRYISHQFRRLQSQYRCLHWFR